MLPSSIDLHGVRHGDVERLLDVFIWQAMQERRRGFQIVTGNSQAMKDVVIAVLQEYSLTWSETPFNSGVLNVDL